MVMLHLSTPSWALPRAEVDAYWADFTAASGGLYTLSLPAALQTLLSEQPVPVQQATWALLLLDTTAAELIVLDETGAEPSGAGGCARTHAEPTPHAPAPSPHAGPSRPLLSMPLLPSRAWPSTRPPASPADRLSFEEYLIFRRFAEAPSLEEQFRFLWRLYDRDGDGKLGRDDLLTALQARSRAISRTHPASRRRSAVLCVCALRSQLQRARHGWTDVYLQQWADYVWRCG